MVSLTFSAHTIDARHLKSTWCQREIWFLQSQITHISMAHPILRAHTNSTRPENRNITTEKQLQNPHFDIKKYPKESGKKAPQRFFHTANINSRQETRMFSSEKSSIRNCYLRRFFDYSTSKPPPIFSTSSPSLSSILLRLYATC